MQTGALLMMKKDTIHNHTRNTDAIGLFKQTQMDGNSNFLKKEKKRGGGVKFGKYTAHTQ